MYISPAGTLKVSDRVSEGCLTITSRHTPSFSSMSPSMILAWRVVLPAMTQVGTENSANMTALWDATWEESGVGLSSRSRFSICRRYSLRVKVSLLEGGTGKSSSSES